jgi:hypothetical protein
MNHRSDAGGFRTVRLPSRLVPGHIHPLLPGRRGCAPVAGRRSVANPFLSLLKHQEPTGDKFRNGGRLGDPSPPMKGYISRGRVVSPKRPRGPFLPQEPLDLRIRNTSTNIPKEFLTHSLHDCSRPIPFHTHPFPMKPASPFYTHRHVGGRLGDPSPPIGACISAGRVVSRKRPRGAFLPQEPGVSRTRNMATNIPVVMEHAA